MTDLNKCLKYLFYHVKRRFFWWQKWVILIKQISSEEPFPDSPAGYVLRLASKADYPALIAAYPGEFSAHLPEAAKRKQLMARVNRMKCFLITDQAGHIKGACWCSPYKNSAIRPQGVDQERLFEMMNTFIVDNARGNGLSEVLRRFAIASMAAEGYRAVISFVWYSRIGSLKMNLNTGSRVLGEKTLYSILAIRWTRYRPYVAVNKLPIRPIGKVVLLGHDESVIRPFSLELSRYGVSTVWGMKESGSWSRIKCRLRGCTVSDLSGINGRGASVLPVLNENDKGFVVPLDNSGEQALMALEQSRLLNGYQSLRLSAEQLSFSEANISGLPAAVSHSSGLSSYFHGWSAK